MQHTGRRCFAWRKYHSGFSSARLIALSLTRTFDEFAQAIASYEGSDSVSPFTSKFDYYLAGSGNLTTQEQNGTTCSEARAAATPASGWKVEHAPGRKRYWPGSQPSAFVYRHNVQQPRSPEKCQASLVFSRILPTNGVLPPTRSASVSPTWNGIIPRRLLWRPS